MDNHPVPNKCLVVGNSHIFALNAAAELSSSVAQSNTQLRFHFIHVDEYTREANQRALAAISELGVFSESDQWRVVSTLGGNEHTAIGLITAPVPFDICLPDEPHLAFREDADQIPFDVFRDVIASWAVVWWELLTELRQRFPAAILHLGPPPPIADEDFIRNNLGEPMERLATLWGPNINPPLQRYKTWRGASMAISKRCKEIGVSFLSPPPQACSEGPFLNVRLAADSTHGNADYGELQLIAIRRFFDAAQGLQDRSEPAIK